MMSHERRGHVPPPITPETFARVREGDKDAKAAIVGQYGRFVQGVATRYARSLPSSAAAIDRDDLVQVGMEGLLRAAEIHDPDRGKFLTIASHYVTGRMRKEITSMRSAVRIPTHTRSMIGQVEGANLARRSRRRPLLSDSEVAEMLDIPEKGSAIKQSGKDSKGSAKKQDGTDLINVNTIRFARLIGDHMGSMDRGYSPQQDMSTGNEYILDERSGLENVAGGTLPASDSSTLESDIPYIVGEALSHLREEERAVVKLRYGLDEGGEPRTLEEVGLQVGMSRGDVRKMEMHAINKLRQPHIAPRLSSLLDD